MYNLQQSDFGLMYQHSLTYAIKIEVLEEDNVISVLQGVIQGGSSTITAESDIRRTFSATIIPTWKNDIKVNEDSLIWLNKDVILYIGIQDIRTKEFKWWKQGKFVFASTSGTYDVQNNQLSISCSDQMTLLDGTKNGQLGSLTISIPAYDVYRLKGEVDTMDKLPNISEEGNTLTAGDVYKVKADGHYYKCGTYYLWDDIGTDLEGYIRNQGGKLEIEENEEGWTSYFRHNIIRDVFIHVLKDLGKFENYIIDDIGTSNAFERFNKSGWNEYRNENITWNTVPYDQEFSAGCSVLSILQGFRDLYPNYEMFFNEEGTFICQMIPTCDEDDIMFRDDFLQKILISESTSVDLLTVKNICEVWGQVIDIDFYTDTSTYNNNVYECSISSWDKEYKNNDKLGIKIPVTNKEHPSINVNGFGNVKIYDEVSGEELDEGVLEADTVYVIRISKKRVNKENVIKAYLMGHWQAHAINVLTDGTTDGLCTLPNGEEVIKYSEEYFQKVYNCETIGYTIIPDSPFTVQKLGEILDVKTGGEFENITSDSLALLRAEYENWKTSRLTDSITITTLLVPFLDVNVKVSYRRSDSDVEEQYIIKSVSHNFDSGQSSIQMMKFYPFYNNSNIERGVYRAINTFDHYTLAKYEHSQIPQLKAKTIFTEKK